MPTISNLGMTNGGGSDDLVHGDGTTSQYIRGNGSKSDLAGAVRGVALTGLSTATNAAVAATDTVLSAAGKLQAQVSALKTASPKFAYGSVSADMTTTLTSVAVSVIFPTAFSSVPTVVCTPPALSLSQPNTYAHASVSIISVSTTGFSAFVSGGAGSVPVRYIAIGT
jgi:hypothetical protein